MDNHTHLLIYTENIEELSKVMSKTNTAYGIFYNKNENRVGYVFRNRFYSQAIKNENHLDSTIAYIHNNPVKAGIVRKMKDYRFSSYNNIKSGKIEKTKLDLLFHVDDYLEKFNFIHKNFKEIDILEVKEDLNSKVEIKNYINEYSEKNDIDILGIRRNNQVLKDLINKVKSKYSVTNKDLCEIFGVGKNRITNLMKENNEN